MLVASGVFRDGDQTGEPLPVRCSTREIRVLSRFLHILSGRLVPDGFQSLVKLSSAAKAMDFLPLIWVIFQAQFTTTKRTRGS